MCDLIAKNAVTRQFSPNRLEVAELRLDPLDAVRDCRLGGTHGFGATARRPRPSAHDRQQRLDGWAGIAEDADIRCAQSRHLDRVDLDANYLEPRWPTPVVQRLE